MSARFEGSARIERPAASVFAFLLDGENDPKFSPRVVEIAKRTDGPPGVGTVYASTVRDAGMTTKREFELTRADAPTQIRWREISKNLVTAPEGGYDLREDGGATELTVFNELQGHGFGVLLTPLAVRAARKDAGAFAGRIKAAVEGAVPAA